MIDGITVYNVIPVYEYLFSPGLTLLFLVLAVISLLCILIFVNYKNDFPSFLSLTCSVIFFILFFIGLCAHTKEIDYNKYVVTIDDTVSMTEFYDNYKVLSQDGLLYTIVERRD